MFFQQRAFTFLEMLVVIIIAGILLMVALPSWQIVISRNKAKTYAEQLVRALQFTRLAAIERGENVRFCKSADHQNCGGSWNDGQIIITHDNTVLRVFPALPRTDKLIWQSSFSKNDFVEFLPSGNTNAQQGSFFYCPHDVSQARAVIMQQTGHVRISERTAQGEVISCD